MSKMKIKDVIRKFIRLTALTLLFLATAQAMAKEQLRIGMNKALQEVYSPLYEFTEKAFERLPWTLVWVDAPLARSIHEANQGNLDGEAFRIREMAAGYPNLMLVPTPLLEVVFYIAVPASNSCPPADNLEGFRVGRLNGTEVFNRLPEPLDRQAVGVPSINSYTAMLRSERIDGIIVDSIALAGLASQGLDLRLCQDHEVIRTTAHMLLHRRHADKIEAIDQAFRRLKASQENSGRSP